jgi:hypothetical protein
VSSPRRDRPVFPAGYGISTEAAGMLEWERVDRALAGAAVYWLATVRPDGGPHTTPIWGSWAHGGLHFDGGDTTRWARNLAVNPAISVGVDHHGLNITLQGQVRVITPDPDRFAAVADGYAAKYPYRPELHAFWCVEPEVVLAWDISSLEAFAATPTRFRFEED